MHAVGVSSIAYLYTRSGGYGAGAVVGERVVGTNVGATTVVDEVLKTIGTKYVKVPQMTVVQQPIVEQVSEKRVAVPQIQSVEYYYWERKLNAERRSPRLVHVMVVWDKAVGACNTLTMNSVW